MQETVTVFVNVPSWLYGLVYMMIGVLVVVGIYFFGDGWLGVYRKYNKPDVGKGGGGKKRKRRKEE